jgi:hypothetical protein
MNMSLVIEPVTATEQTRQVAELARDIWTEHYVPIIGRDQVDYMLDRFQSSDAIARQIESGCKYYLASVC